MKKAALLLCTIFAFALKTNAQENTEVSEWSIWCESAQNGPSYMIWIEAKELTLECAEDENSMIFEGSASNINATDAKKLGNLSKIAVETKTAGEPYKITKVTYKDSAKEIECTIHFVITSTNEEASATAAIKR